MYVCVIILRQVTAIVILFAFFHSTAAEYCCGVPKIHVQWTAFRGYEMSVAFDSPAYCVQRQPQLIVVIVKDIVMTKTVYMYGLDSWSRQRLVVYSFPLPQMMLLVERDWLNCWSCCWHSVWQSLNLPDCPCNSWRKDLSCTSDQPQIASRISQDSLRLLLGYPMTFDAFHWHKYYRKYWTKIRSTCTVR